MVKQFFQKATRVLFEKTIIQESTINAWLISTAFLHRDTFLPYKNYCKGVKDIVVCGAGPSLNQYIPIADCIHIAVNRAFLYNKVDFDFIFAQDFEGINMVQDQLITYRPDKCIKFLGTQFEDKKRIPESLIIKANAKKFNTGWFIPGSGSGGELVVDIDRMPICNMYNVGQSVMQLALYMNPRKIYIAGCDMSGNHFSKGNQSEIEFAKEGEKLDKIWNERSERLIARWKEIKKFASVYYPETEIISINPIGLKGIFKDIYQ